MLAERRASIYKQALKKVVPVRQDRQRRRGQATAAKIVNVVATFALLPPAPPGVEPYRLPLDAVSLHMGCSQYAPSIFAANIIKLRDFLATVTVLLFDSGRGVIVSAQSLNHARYIGQLLRSILEQIACPILCRPARNGKEGEPGGGKEIVYNHSQGALKGRTIFSNLTVHNIVANSDLGFRINLQAMCDAAPSCCKWKPDIFPGLKCKIWLTPERRCMCGLVKRALPMEELQVILGKQKCVCSVKVLIFDTGMIVITGGRTLHAVNSVLQQIRALTPTFKNTGMPVPKEARFYERLATMMVPAAAAIGDDMDAGDGEHRVQHKALEGEDAVTHMLEALDNLAAPLRQTAKAQAAAAATRHLPPLIRMCLAGRVSNVRDTLYMDPSGVPEAIQHMQSLGPHERHERYHDIMTLLQTFHP